MNKSIVEELANQAYTLEIENQPENKIWMYRKAAWAIEDLEQDVSLIYQLMGVRGLQNIPEAGLGMVGVVEHIIKSHSH